MRCADGAVQSFQGEDDVQRNNTRGSQNLLPVGKGLVKEGCDGGVAHASDSDRATEFGRGDRVKSVIAETLGEGKIAAGASRGIISHHTATFSKICSSCAKILKPL